MYCRFLLIIAIANPSSDSLARRQNAVVSINSNDIVLLSLTSSTNCWLHCISLLIADVTADFINADPALALLCQLLIVMTSLLMSSSLIPDLALLCQLLILDFFQSAMLTSSLLLAASSSRHADVIIAESRFLFASIQQLISSFFALLIPDFYCSSSSSNLSPAFSEYHNCGSNLTQSRNQQLQELLDSTSPRLFTQNLFNVYVQRQHTQSLTSSCLDALALLCQLLIVMTSLLMSSSLIPDLALLCQLLILDFFQSAMLTSSLLLAASSSRHADVIIAESRFLFASIQQLISSFFALLIPDFYCSSSSSNLSPAFSEYHSCWSKLASA
ncbi:hypothetical protein F511_30109 [Dorcoceras hygrometricum]|uniref:Uncharacterized protein n=1 Tax=Dorcoceras hygrometricum TaxID=472368 RepID=A0A2Z7CE67_9LAMI|nr:hypothetical protein F511_30109 [Dorcoceras hygrometricum]